MNDLFVCFINYFIFIIQPFIFTDPTLGDDKLEDVTLIIVLGTVTTTTIEVKWNPVAEHRISGYTIYFKESAQKTFTGVNGINKLNQNHILNGLKPNTEYQVKMVAIGFNNRQSKESSLKTVQTLNSKIYF